MANRGKKAPLPTCLGLDGEGYTQGKVYSYMACASMASTVDTCEDLHGLSTAKALSFLTQQPKSPLKFGFSLGYDYTKILEDLPDKTLWLLCRPEERMPDLGPPSPIYFAYRDDPSFYTDAAQKEKARRSRGSGGVFELNMLGGRLSIRKFEGHGNECTNPKCAGCVAGAKSVLWDCFKFFQSSFVKACLDWNVISPDEFEFLSELKKKRPEFAKPKNESDSEWLEIKRYCQLECAKMADLATRLLVAHEDAGLHLRQYYGAGSTGAAMLEKMNARAFIRHRIVHVRESEISQDNSTHNGNHTRNGNNTTHSSNDITRNTQTSHTPTGQTGKVQWRRIEYDSQLMHAIACSFFGGRFEIAEYGPVTLPCHSYDISSAYPYAFTFLPCLVHGKWRHIKAESTTLATQSTCGTTSSRTKNSKPHASRKEDWLHDQIEKSQTALVRYSLPWVESLGRIENEMCERTWGPFPFRVGDGLEPFANAGDIVFPVTSGGGWVCREEYLAGRGFSENVVPLEAWIYETSCRCRVLRDLMPENYKLRCFWGKEGKGQVAKLGQNSCYGKAAQTKGKSPPYQEFVWALLTTGSCRAQLLRAMTGANQNVRESVILLATDGIIATQKLDVETPRDTGTFDTIDIKSGKKKPLGGWEHKELPDGVFLIRPGIAFPLGTEKLDERGQKKAEAEFKARGIGKHVLRSLRQEVLDDWQAAQGPVDKKTSKQLFFGMKSQVYQLPISGAREAPEYKRTPRYGQFGMQSQKISYSPTPKRPAVGDGKRFMTWALRQDRLSIPYGPILGKPKAISPLHQQLIEEKRLAEDQDDYQESDHEELKN